MLGLPEPNPQSGIHNPQLSSKHLSQVLQQSVKQLVRTAPSIELAEQPGAQALGLPHVLHRYFGGAALELEGEEGAGAGAAADLDPAVGVGRVVVDDLDFDVDAAAVALEEDAVAVAAARELGGGLHRPAAREPFGHAGGVGDEREDFVDRRADGAGVGEGNRTHRCWKTTSCRGSGERYGKAGA